MLNSAMAEEQIDSLIYNDLFKFFSDVELIKPEWVEPRNPREAYIQIKDLLNLNKEIAPSEFDKEFGVYYVTNPWVHYNPDNLGIYILIKYKNEYTIYNSYNFDGIIINLLDIKKLNTKFTNDLLTKYIEALKKYCEQQRVKIGKYKMIKYYPKE